MANQHNTDVSKEELQQAERFWHSFTAFTKYGIIGIIVVLGLMALFLL